MLRAVRAAAALALLLVLAAPARAQNRADTKLWLRVDGDDVKAAVEIVLEPGYHIGHGPTAAEVGGPDAAGMPTTLAFAGAGFEWSAARFPEPEREEQSFGATKTWLNIHYGTPVLWVRGRKVDPAADPATIELTIRGQTCNAAGCVPYKQKVKSGGAGSDKLFEKFPADLLAPGVVAAEEPPTESMPVAAAPSAAPSATPPTDAPSGGFSAAALLDDGHATAELFVRDEGESVRAAVQITVAEGYHLGHGPSESDVGGPGAIGAPTTFTFAGEGIEWSAPRFPTPEKEPQEFGSLKTFLWVHHGTFVVHLLGKKAPGADLAALTLTVVGQTCNEAGCVPWKQVVKPAGSGGDALFAAFPSDLVVGAVAATQGGGASAAASGASGSAAGDHATDDGAPEETIGAAPVNRASEKLEELPLGLFLLTAFGWGLFSLLMPCTYPMIPITISYFTKQATARQTSILPLSLTYGAGIVIIYVVIGALVGPIIIPFATHWVTNLIIGTFFVVFSLSLFGLLLLQPPQFLMQAAGKATRKGGYVGVFLMGATLVITSFTCTAPFVGTLLAAGASSMPRVVMGMTVFGLTMAIPFVFLSLLPGKAKTLPKSGEWMHTLKVCLGFVELAAALKFFSNADLVLQWGIISKELFYLWWAGLFAACALYLFGVIRLHEDSEPVLLEPGMPVKLHPSIGSGRMVAGIAFLLFALYNLHGALGNKLDWVMNVMAPPYSSRIGGGDGHGGGEVAAGPVIVIDAHDEACARAEREGKLVVINFTGFT
ncbi:MAG: hypothetical protein JNL90_01475 [Planctomycetes bacterium]|nr:hypothetical protein [Planctomycetota bacterium]